MSQIRVPFRQHFDFRPIPDIRVMESFAYNDFVFAGVQRGIWPYDEYYWSERKGAWGGVLPMPTRESVGDLRLQEATRETFGPFDEPLDRLPSGTSLTAQSRILYRFDYYALTVPESATEHRLYSCATGALVAEAGFGGALGPVPDGSYLLWARVFAGDVFETGHGPARAKDGEWSALRVVVGAGAWNVAPGVCPAPGAALYRKPASAPEVEVAPTNDSSYRHLFDPLARSVSASCVLDHDVLSADGTPFIPRGSLLIGGLRSSASGPQTALWWLKTDGSARLLGLQTEFTDGVCECAKTNHFASDVVQSPLGDVFVLTECALFRFDPGALSVYETLPGYPAQSLTPFAISEGARPEAGHPGGNCLRFPARNEMVHWTEALGGGITDGTAHYNRIVRRVSGRDTGGPSTLWHGTNCAEMFLGRFWAVRSDDNETLYLDWIDNGRWHGFEGMARDMTATFWQRLRTVNDTLYLFGYRPSVAIPLEEPNHTNGLPPLDSVTGKPLSPDPQGPQSGALAAGDHPLCAVADGMALRDAALPFFVRRATPSGAPGKQKLFLAARADGENIGPANRVVELVTDGPIGTHICSFWNEATRSFALLRADYEAVDGAPSKLPPFFTWHPQSGTAGGGKWKAASSAPSSGYFLETRIESPFLRFYAQPDGILPYDVAVWNRLCFDILPDGSPDPDGPVIEPTCHDAACAIAGAPPGTRFRVIERLVPTDGAPLTSFQITDASRTKRLSLDRDTFPSLWYRVDSSAPRSDLSTYTHLASYDRLLVPPASPQTRLEVVVLVPPHSFPLQSDELPLVQRRS